MKNIAQSYLAFTSISYRLIVLVLIPVGILLLRIVLTLRADYADDFLPQWVDILPVCLFELLSDHWLFGGFCGKENHTEYIHTSGYGERIIRNALTGDLLRRMIYLMVYAYIIFAFTGRIRSFLMSLATYICVTAALNISRHIKMAQVHCSFCISVAVVYNTVLTLFYLFRLTDDGLLLRGVLWKLPLLAAAAFFISIFTLRHMMFYVREGYYDRRQTLTDVILHRPEKRI